MVTGEAGEQRSIEEQGSVANQGSGNDCLRIALAMIRSEWQDGSEDWDELYAVCDDPAQLARELTHLCRETLAQLANVAGISSGEMLHRQAARLIPHPEAGQVTLVNLADGTASREP